MDEKEVDVLERIDNLSLEIAQLRQKPLLILYWPEDGEIKTADISDLYDELRRGLGTEKITDIDILIHTYGGNPDEAYRIIQLIRSFASNISMLVPYHAYSAGSLICLGSNKIYFGAYASLSPIDISLVIEDKNIELIAIDKYIEFVKHCKDTIENNIDGSTEIETNIEDALLVEFVKQIGAINIGIFFREREVTKYYAEILLDQYMLNNAPDKEESIKHIVNMMVFKFPSHEFEIDYNIAKRVGLSVEEMPTDLSDRTKSLIKLLEEALKNEMICRYIGDEYRLPYFRLYNNSEGGN